MLSECLYHTDDNLIHQRKNILCKYFKLLINFFFAAEVRRVRVSGVTGGARLFNFVFLNTQHVLYRAICTLDTQYILHIQHSTCIALSTLNQHILCTASHKVECVQKNSQSQQFDFVFHKRPDDTPTSFLKQHKI